MHEHSVKLSDLIEQAVELSDDASCDLREVSFELEAACKHVGLEIMHRFDDDLGRPVPYELLEQIRGRESQPLMEVEYEGERWKIVSIDLPPEFDGIASRVIPDDHSPRWLALVRSDLLVDDLPC